MLASTAARTRLVAAATLVVTLVAGIALGWGGAHWAMERARARHRHFLDQLGLSSAQRVRVDSILHHRRAQMDAFWTGPGLQLRAIVDSTRAEIRGVLTPVQQRAFDAARARARAHARAEATERGHRSPPPDGGHP